MTIDRAASVWTAHPGGPLRYRANSRFGADGLPPGAWFGRVSAVVEAPDGSVVVFQRGPSIEPIVVLDREGQYLRSWDQGFGLPHGMRLMPDGNLWLTDAGRHRVLKTTLDGEILLELGTAGVAGTDEKTFNRPTDVAVAADGSAWFTLAGCTLARVSPAGEVTIAPAPIPARRLAFDPAGGMWLASGARLVHVAPGEPFGPCDERPPSLRIGPGRDGGAVSLRALRRAGGLRMTVREPAAVSAFALYGYGSEDEFDVDKLRDTTVTAARGRTVRYPVSAARLRRLARRLAAGDRTSLVLFAGAADAEGNVTGLTHTVRVKP